MCYLYRLSHSLCLSFSLSLCSFHLFFPLCNLFLSSLSGFPLSSLRSVFFASVAASLQSLVRKICYRLSCNLPWLAWSARLSQHLWTESGRPSPASLCTRFPQGHTLLPPLFPLLAVLFFVVVVVVVVVYSFVFVYWVVFFFLLLFVVPFPRLVFVSSIFFFYFSFVFHIWFVYFF